MIVIITMIGVLLYCVHTNVHSISSRSNPLLFSFIVTINDSTYYKNQGYTRLLNRLCEVVTRQSRSEMPNVRKGSAADTGISR